MKAIILAAGRGSRLADKTNSLPKCMTKLWGKSLIDWQIDVLKNAGIREIGIVVGYQAEKVNLDQVHYFNNNRWGDTSVLTSLLTARSWLENADCIIAYSDILYTQNTIETLAKSKEAITITYNTNFLELWNQRFENPLTDLETFKINEHSDLVDIGRKTCDIKEIEGQFMGLLKFSSLGFKKVSTVLDSLDQGFIDKLDMTGLLKTLLDYNIMINTIPCSDFWIEIDNLHDLELYESWGNVSF